MPNKIEVEKKEVDAVTTEFNTRRRLLKASAAAPLIATLAPNAALAQGSLMCAKMGLDNAALQDAPKVSFTSDNAVRVPGTCWTRIRKRDGKLIKRYEVPRSSGNFYKPKGGAVGPNFSTQKFDSQDCYFLQYFDVLDDGSAQSSDKFFPVTRSGDVIAESCWTSISALGNFKIN